MRIIGGSAENLDSDWDPGPRHPSDDVRFIVRFDAYPGGQDAYWRDFRAAVAAHGQHMEDYLDEPPRDHESLQREVDNRTYYALKRRVFDVSEVVRCLARVTSRNLAHWLVKDRGFPWRNDCTVEDLNRLLRFLQDPATVDLARFAPDYPTRIPPSRDGELSLEPAAVHEVIVRHAAGQIGLDETVALLSSPFVTAARERDDQDIGRSIDALDVVGAARSALLDEGRYQALVNGLQAGAGA